MTAPGSWVTGWARRERDATVPAPSRRIDAVDRPNDIRARLEKARLQGRRRDFRIRAPTLLVGAVAIASGMVLSAQPSLSPISSFFTALIQIGIFILVLTVLPTDGPIRVRAILFSIAMLIFLGAVFQVGFISVPRLRLAAAGQASCEAAGSPCWFHALYGGAHAAASAVYFVAVAILGRQLVTRAPVRKLVQSLWRAVGAVYLSSGLAVGARMAAAFAIGAADVEPGVARAGLPILVTSLVVLGALAIQPSFRMRAQAWLAARGEAVGSAAGLAALLGDRRVDTVLNQAARLLRCMPASLISYDHFAVNLVDASLYGLTTRGYIGNVDVFLSHSWHDDPRDKWDALQAWRRAFVRKHQREPIVWFDKCCIDQSNISLNLASLPIFLASSRRLLIVYGPTYMSRLWCIVELFIFIEMGGKAEQVDLVFPEGHPVDALVPHEFDVHLTKCSNDADRHRLLTTIESGFRGLDDFNALIRSVLAAIKEQHLQREGKAANGVRSLERHHINGNPRAATVSPRQPEPKPVPPPTGPTPARIPMALPPLVMGLRSGRVHSGGRSAWRRPDPGAAV